MPEIEKCTHQSEPPEHEDAIVKFGKYRFYFQNYYQIISLISDLLLGALYFGGSLSNLLDGPKKLGQVLFLIGSFFLIMRPVLKILRHVYFYHKEN